MTLIEILESREEALNVHQVAELLGVSEKKVYRLAAGGVLPAFRVGKAIRFDAQDVADWLRRKKPSDERPDSRMSHKSGVSASERNGEQASPPGHIWRGKVRSLETALAVDSLSDSKAS
jgi:excisionase family DNA binding protein